MDLIRGVLLQRDDDEDSQDLQLLVSDVQLDCQLPGRGGEAAAHTTRRQAEAKQQRRGAQNNTLGGLTSMILDTQNRRPALSGPITGACDQTQSRNIIKHKITTKTVILRST